MVVSRSAVIVVLLLIAGSNASSVSDAKTVPLAIMTSSSIELAPAKIGNVISAELLSQTTIAAIAENVEKLVLIVMPKLSYSHLTYDANYNNQHDTQNLVSALESMSSVLYPAVSNIDRLSLGAPSTILHINAIADLKIEDIVKAGRNVQVRLGGGLSLHDADAVLGSIVKTLNSAAGHSFSVIYTADEADEWVHGIPSAHHDAELAAHKEETLARYKRQTRTKSKVKAAASAASLRANSPNNTIIQYGGNCFLFFTESFRLVIKNTTNNKEAVAPNIKVYRPTNNGTDGNCTTNPKNGDGFNVTFPITDMESLGNFSKLTYTFEVVMRNPWEWIVKAINVDYASTDLGSGYVVFKPDSLTAQLQFSYHCDNPDPIVKVDKPNAMYAEITLKNVQVQAFDVTGNQFGWQCDCVGFFTSAIWAGLIVSAIYLMIIALALVMLMNLATMDRFEDPKGQGLKIQSSG